MTEPQTQTIIDKARELAALLVDAPIGLPSHSLPITLPMKRLSTVLLSFFLIAAPVNAETVRESLLNMINKQCSNYEPSSYDHGICKGITRGMYLGIILIKCDIFSKIYTKNESKCEDIGNDFYDKTYDFPPYKDFFEYLGIINGLYDSYLLLEVFQDYINPP